MSTIKFSDFLIILLERLNFSICFGVTGGFSMYLNNAFGNSNNIKNVYNHHEQASIFSAIGYFKTINKIPIVCVTAGCGVTNTITGIMDCWQDSVPCLIISGQTNSKKTINYNKSKNVHFRHYSGQDVDIIDMVKNITKYAIEFNCDHTINNIINILIESLSELFIPRFGPVLLSIPLDIQNLIINDYDNILNIILTEINNKINNFNNTYIISDEIYKKFIKMIIESNKPLILAGGGIKTSKSIELFLNFINKYNIPIVTTYSSIDILSTDSQLYQGRIGIYGERCGNYTIQQCDLLIIIGSRLSETSLGYNEHLFNSCKKIIINIEDEILKINKINYDLFIKCDISNFFKNLLQFEYIIDIEWLNNCNIWKKMYFFDKPKSEIIISSLNNNKIKPYNFFEIFSNFMENNSLIIPAAGSIYYILRHMIKIKDSTKIITSSQQDLGYELPFAIGAYFALSEINNNYQLFSFNGDGSFQFNIQELQTIKYHNIPVKIIIFNNNKYGCIEITQKTYFGINNVYGINSDTGLSFPNFEKIAYAYDIDYLYIDSINWDVNYNKLFCHITKPIIIEINAEYQDRYPKLGVYINENGEIIPTPFHKMNPQI